MPAGSNKGGKGSGTEVKQCWVYVLTCDFSPKPTWIFLKLHYQYCNIKQKKRLSLSFSYASVFAAWTLPIFLFVSPSLHSCSLSLFPLPFLLFPLLTLPIPSSYSASQVTMTGGFLASFSLSFCVHVCDCMQMHACVCVSPSALSCVLVPASWQQGATQQPVCDWAGEWGSWHSTVLTALGRVSTDGRG